MINIFFKLSRALMNFISTIIKFGIKFSWEQNCTRLKQEHSIDGGVESHIPVFLFQVLFQQFKFFLNLYFLLMAISQFIPELRLGYLYTYWGPLVSWIIILSTLFISLFLTKRILVILCRPAYRIIILNKTIKQPVTRVFHSGCTDLSKFVNN